MKRWSMPLWGAAVWLGACGTPLGQAELTTDRGAYAPGEDVTLRLHNGSIRALGYNLCGVSLQRRSATGWESAQSSQEICQSILLELGPGGEESVHRTLDGALPTGEYRYLTHVEWDGEREALGSTPFHIHFAREP